MMSAEDGDAQNLQTHKPVGFLCAVDFRADASAPRKWLGILTQRRVLYFGVFTEDPGRFLALPTAYVGLWLVGMHQGPRWPAFFFGLQQISQRAWPEDHSSLGHITWGRIWEAFCWLGFAVVAAAYTQ